MVHQWSQELLGCDFPVVHHPNIMMSDVDALSTRYENLSQPMMMLLLSPKMYICDDALMHITIFFACKKLNMNIVPNPIEPRPISTTRDIMKVSTADNYRDLLDHTTIRSHEVIFYSYRLHNSNHKMYTSF